VGLGPFGPYLGTNTGTRADLTASLDHAVRTYFPSLLPHLTELTVENTGDKLGPLLASTLTEPFRRGTERVHADHAGVGLGLAIVKTITRAHDGTLTLTPRSAGGIRVTVELPATSPHTDG